MPERKVLPFATSTDVSQPQMKETTQGLSATLMSKVVGQPNGIGAIVPCVEMFMAGLAPENRPAGVFLLLGPTGTGKTRTVEALAEALHGSAKNILKVDCGEFQMEHEVAKLIGAPPGYLGHRETQPMLSQQRLTAVASPKCGLSIILFDEIEKAAPSMARLLLGVLDRGVLRLGDNAAVNFEKTIVFMTSNLGSRDMMRELTPDFGFQAAVNTPSRDEMKAKLQSIGLAAVRRRFSPEFVNRIDHVVTYEPLSARSLAAIADHEIDRLQKHIDTRLGVRAFTLDVPWETRQWLIEKGTSPEYGARELKRTVHRFLTQPLAAMVARQQLTPGCFVRIETSPDRAALRFKVLSFIEAAMPGSPTVVLVDDNAELLKFLAHSAADCGWDAVPARTIPEARRLSTKRKPHAAIIDLDMSGGAGLDLALQLRQASRKLQVALTSEAEVPANIREICREHNFAVISKPYRIGDVLGWLQEKVLASRKDI
ncbi:MAG TPA: AAA family ATPase [Bryobacteraceae bacterium]|nr:AAA family ATPase [Bryobacteraceae bacterium]